MAAPTERHEETRTVPPEPTNGKPVGEEAVNSLVPPGGPQKLNPPASAPASEAPTQGLLAKATDIVSGLMGTAKAPEHGPATGTVSTVKEGVDQLKGGIEVRAVAPGFVEMSRKNVGDVFKVRDESQLGEWMMPTDEKMAKAHRERIAEKRKKGREEADRIRQNRRSILGL